MPLSVKIFSSRDIYINQHHPPCEKNGHTFQALHQKPISISHLEDLFWIWVLTQGTVIPRELARWTGTVELDATDPTDVVVGHVPTPGSDGIPLFDGDLHGSCTGGLIDVWSSCYVFPVFNAEILQEA